MLQELSVLILLSVLVEERMKLVILFVTCRRSPSLYCLLKEVEPASSQDNVDPASLTCEFQRQVKT